MTAQESATKDMKKELTKECVSIINDEREVVENLNEENYDED